MQPDPSIKGDHNKRYVTEGALLWPLELDRGSEYRAGFGIRLDVGKGVPEAQGLLVNIDTGGASTTYFSTKGNAFAKSSTLLEKDLGPYTKKYIGGQASGTLIRESYVAIHDPTAQQLLLKTKEEKAMTLLHVPRGNAVAPHGLTMPMEGNMGLSFGYSGHPNLYLRHHNPWFDAFKTDARNRQLGTNYASVFSFDLTHEDGRWHESPKMVVNGLPHGGEQGLLRFPLATGIQVPEVKELRDKLVSLFVDYLHKRHEAFKKESLDIVYLVVVTSLSRGTFEREFFPRFLKDLPQLQQEDHTKYGWPALHKLIEFQSSVWLLEVTRIRVGDLVISATDAANELNCGWDIKTSQECEKEGKLMATPSGLYDWVQEDGGAQIRQISQPSPAPSMASTTEQDALPDMRYHVQLDTGCSLVTLAKPLLEIFERQFVKNGNVCKNGPVVGFELVNSVKRGPGDDTSASWYFLTPKDYCYCEGVLSVKGRLAKHCFQEETQPKDRTAMLGLPFYRAFYVGHDYLRREVVLPRLR
ncbi:unnamed protein product [Amoebophrya sp. A25]|nr:unnamed protein product [Amoebophrya sp. A25]|eukprot:GSA25T00020942001.1